MTQRKEIAQQEVRSTSTSTSAHGTHEARERFANTLRTNSLALRRGYTLEVTPVPIPNTAVKLQRADDTASVRGGKVGRRDVNL